MVARNEGRRNCGGGGLSVYPDVCAGDNESPIVRSDFFSLALPRDNSGLGRYPDMKS